ncbi:hypothetical protein SFRURICE_014112 [Spodoptera frugiperda]|nr:hypothetical protein SFRURICE_014112 [Spodoptera frugiperda]
MNSDCTVGAVARQLAAMQRVAGSIPAITLCLIQRLLFRVWVSCVARVVAAFALRHRLTSTTELGADMQLLHSVPGC